MMIEKTWGRSLLVFLLLATFLFPTPPGKAQVIAPVLPPNAVTPLDIKEIRLDNGLRIFVLERHSSPTFAGLYQFNVGGAMDPKGKSGIAHLLEHMMFKGTKTIGTRDAQKEAELMARQSDLCRQLNAEEDRQDDPFHKADPEKIAELKRKIHEIATEHKKLVVQNEYDEIMQRAGSPGTNAATSSDTTTYIVELPSNRLEFWFRMESDRLMNPVFREFYPERDVAVEERRLRDETSPDGLMYEAKRALLFTAHPYGGPVVGWPSDVARLLEQDARAYFKTHYSPSNCIMVLVGDVKVSEVERLVKQYFGPWKRQEIPRRPFTAEPEQRGERRRVVEFDAEPQISISWMTVREGASDQYPLEILGSILGGLWSSRLDKTIVQEERVATGVNAGDTTMRQGGYFTVSASLAPGHNAAEVEKAIWREVKRVQDEGVSADELERAKVQMEAQRVSRLKSNLGLAYWIADAVGVSGGLAYMTEYERHIYGVTVADVQNVARKYLQPGKACVVELRKTAGAGKAESTGDTSHGRTAEGLRGGEHSTGFAEMMEMIRDAPPIRLKIPQIGKDVDRVLLPSGVTVFIKEDHTAPSVSMKFSWIGGFNSVPVEDLAPFELAGDLLNEGGTESLDPIVLTERKEALGMRFSIQLGNTSSRASFWSLKRNFKEAFDLATDVIMGPRFDEERLKTLKGQYVDEMRRRWDEPSSGVRMIQWKVLDGGHPRLGRVVTRAEIERVTPEQCRRAWRRFIGRDNLFITVVGDFDKKRVLEMIEAKFKDFHEAVDKRRVWITRDPVFRPGMYLVEKDLPQLAVRVSEHLPVDRTAPIADHAALEIFNNILGGSFRSRLIERLRTDEGLTYDVYSDLEHENRPNVPGEMEIGFQTNQTSVARSVGITVTELRKIADTGVTAAEVDEQIESWHNRFVFEFTNDFYSVSRLMSLELDDRPYDWDSARLEAVQRSTPEDVQRVAKRYLDPTKLTIAVFGTPCAADRKILADTYGLKVLKREDVFQGGYEEEPPVALK
jgi:predicted Zn-dependent peptidase